MNRTNILTDVEQDMNKLYDQLRGRKIDRIEADSLANIAGKRLKAIQLDLADDIFKHEKTKHLLPPSAAGALTKSA
jgi:hypothetical protein